MEKIKDYNRAFKTMRIVTLASLAGFVMATIVYYFQYKNIVDTSREKIYVVTDKGSFAAYARDDRQVSPFEAQFLSEVFIRAMFSHDADTYDQHVADALNLIDEPSGLMIVESFESGDVKKNYIRWGSRTQVDIDSVRILNTGLPMKAEAYFRQHHYIGSEKKTELAIACQYELVKTHRHKKNPFGLLISQLDFIPYPKNNF